MSLRENPVILRQGFNKLWTNNIYLPEESPQHLQFISVYKSYLMAWQFVHQKYTKLVSNRVTNTDLELDFYANIYKYRRNKEYRRKPNNYRKVVFRQRGYKYTLPGRFEKNTMYQQVFQEFANISLRFWTLLFRVREPIRRLPFFKGGKVFAWMRGNMVSLRKLKYFKNTVNQVILLHYYKVVTLFSNHFGREFEKMQKKMHWRLVSAFKRIIFTVPTYNIVGRRFYGLLMEIAGRPKGRDRTVVFRITQGIISAQTFRFRVSFGYGIALAKVGVFGIKTKVAY